MKKLLLVLLFVPFTSCSSGDDTDTNEIAEVTENPISSIASPTISTTTNY